MSLNLNKSFLAPQADKLASRQLKFLMLNAPFTIVFNSYKAKLLSLDLLRNLVSKHNGFTYHPNKNVKSRAFKGFSMVLSPDILNGLVAFAFFSKYVDIRGFLQEMETLNNLDNVSYFSILVEGHISYLSIMKDPSITNPKYFIPAKTIFLCNKILFNSILQVYSHSLIKINLILNAYVKSIS